MDQLSTIRIGNEADAGTSRVFQDGDWEHKVTEDGTEDQRTFLPASMVCSSRSGNYSLLF